MPSAAFRNRANIDEVMGERRTCNQAMCTAFLTLGDALAVLTVPGFAALALVWACSGWSLWRWLHQSELALTLAAALWHWGVAFGDPL